MNKLIFLGCIALVSMALTGGFMVVGGPGYARLEADDRTRAQHLERWGRYYACQVDPDVAGGETLGKGCADQGPLTKMVDPEIGNAYRYARLDPNSFQVCGTFRTDMLKHDNARRYGRPLTFSEGEGWVTYKRNTASTKWLRQ